MNGASAAHTYELIGIGAWTVLTKQGNNQGTCRPPSFCHKKCEGSSEVKDIKIKRDYKLVYEFGCLRAILFSWNPSARSTCSWCSYLIRDQRHIAWPSLCFCTTLERIHVHRGLQAFAGLTLSRYKQTTVEAPVCLSSGPRSSLSKPITVTHSWNQYLTHPWQSELVCTHAQTHAHANPPQNNEYLSIYLSIIVL